MRNPSPMLLACRTAATCIRDVTPEVRDRTARRLALAVAAVLAAVGSAPGKAQSFEWLSGAYSTTGFPASLEAASTLVSSSSADKSLDISLTSGGAWDVRDTGVSFADGVTMTNTGVVKFLGNVGFTGPGGAVFDNRGTLAKTAGTGESVISGLRFVNTGTLNAETGTLVYAPLGDAEFGEGTTFTGAGRHRIAAGGTTYVNLFNLNTGGNLEFAGGHFQTQGATVIQGDLRWTGGILMGSWFNAFGSFGSPQTLSLEGAGDKGVGLFSSFANGQTTVLRQGRLVFGFGADFNNEGTLDIAGDLQVQSLGSSFAGPTFRSEGTVRKSSGTGIAVIDGFELRGSGTFEVTSGTLKYGGDRQLTFTDTARFVGDGIHRFDTGGGVRFEWMTSLGGNLEFAQGTFQSLYSGPSEPSLEISGHLAWSGGSLSGNWSLGTTGVMNIVEGSATKKLGSGSFLEIFDNRGTVTIDGTSVEIAIGQFRNRGSLEVRGDALFSTVDTGGVFTNEGVFRRHGSPLETGIGLILDNGSTGTIAIESGTWRFGLARSWGSGSHRNHGQIEVSSGATLALPFLMENHGRFDLQGALETFDLTNYGILHVSGPDARFPLTTNVHNTGAGLIEFVDGAQSVTLGAFINEGTVAVRGGSRLVATMSDGNTGVIEIASGSAMAAWSGDFDNRGTIRGQGEFSGPITLRNFGTIEAGTATDSLDIVGNLSLMAGGELVVELDTFGTLSPLTVQGMVDFAGTLRVRKGGVPLEVGSALRVVASQGYGTGGQTFDQIVFEGFGTGVVLTPEYDAGQMQLRVAAVPEPGTYALFGVGGLCLAWVRRRRGARVARRA